MNPWYQNMLDAQYARHDRECQDGAECKMRERHVKGTYMPHALRDRVEELQLLNYDARKHLEDMADSLDEVVTQEMIHAQLLEGMKLLTPFAESSLVLVNAEQLADYFQETVYRTSSNFLTALDAAGQPLLLWETEDGEVIRQGVPTADEHGGNFDKNSGYVTDAHYPITVLHPTQKDVRP